MNLVHWYHRRTWLRAARDDLRAARILYSLARTYDLQGLTERAALSRQVAFLQLLSAENCRDHARNSLARFVSLRSLR